MTNLRTQLAEFEALEISVQEVNKNPIETDDGDSWSLDPEQARILQQWEEIAPRMMQHIRQQAELIEELVGALDVIAKYDGGVSGAQAKQALATAEQQGFGRE